MKWRKYTIFTTVEAEDLVSMMLMEHGVEGVQIEDNVPLSDSDTKGMFIDILPEMAPDDGTSRVSFFLHLKEAGSDEEIPADAEKCAGPDGAEVGSDAADRSDAGSAADNSYSIADRLWTEDEIGELLAKVQEELAGMRAYTDIGEGRIEAGETEDTDWRDNWKQYFKPILAGGFLIKPTWETIPNEYAADAASGALQVIEIDPGTAFGTGSHETTQLCLRAIEKYIRGGEQVLDIGTGSGILGIAALKKGAAACMATELDEMCEPSIMDNIAYNGIGEDIFSLLIGNVIGDEDVIRAVRSMAPSGYDVAVANILAPVIVMLAGAGQVDSFVRSGGIFITSGIIDTKEAEVVAAFKANPAWEIMEINRQGEWVSVVARRK
ncbi:MAG: 50S ribosomal protein L11 methyltransferase [Lachnospiraceae bacterium]|nr:50S ribosomal protein L11 methyltransferase [Lachnospiraceae bacterium]